MIPSLLVLVFLVQDAPGAPTSSGVFHEGVSLCSLEAPAVTTDFRPAVRLDKDASFTMVLSKAAAEFGIRADTLLLVERRLGGIILVDVPIDTAPVPGREGAYAVKPKAELRPDDYSFAIKKGDAVAFFGCSFTTLP